jgi:glutathione synthase/RimK-type ligase-like ATP-grasp enzyme
MKKCAFLTMSERGDFEIDDDRSIGPLADIGWDVSEVPWRQQKVLWGDFDAVIIRSTWDYYKDSNKFLNVLTRINKETRLANPLSLVSWNLAKTYLRELESLGVAIVPTSWPERFQPEGLEMLFSRLGCEELVIKPVVGANGDGACRISRSTPESELAELASLFQGRSILVQRFMPAILEEGEYSLFFFNGQFSHAIRKVPAANEFRCQEERGAQIAPVDPEPLLLKAASRALAAIVTPLYARLDMIRDETGQFLVMEFELIEPSLYLRTDPKAPARFARAIDDWYYGD